MVSIKINQIIENYFYLLVSLSLITIFNFIIFSNFTNIYLLIILSILISLVIFIFYHLSLNYLNIPVKKLNHLYKLKSNYLIKPFLIPKLNKNYIIFLEDKNNIYLISIFKIYSIPKGIQQNLEKFIRGLASNSINFFRIYTYDYSNNQNLIPVFYNKENRTQFLDYNNAPIYLDNDINKIQQIYPQKWETNIYFGCFLKIKRKFKYNFLTKNCCIFEKKLSIIQTLFYNTFPHTKIKLLKENELKDFVNQLMFLI